MTDETYDATRAPDQWARNETAAEKRVAARARELIERDSWHSRYNTHSNRLAQALDELGLKIVKAS